jgi:methionyl-tRNA formyltransferase
MQPWPKAFAFWQRPGGSPIRVILPGVHVVTDDRSAPSGTVLPSAPGRLLVKAGRDALELEQLQPDGKRAMSAAEFLRGYPVQPGQTFQ